MPTKRLSKDDFIMMRQTDLAKVFLVDRKTVANWEENGLEPCHDDGTKFYSPVDVVKWRVAQAKDKVHEEYRQKALEKLKQDENRDPDDDTEFELDPQNAYRKWKAKGAKLDYEKKRGNMVDIDAMDEVFIETTNFIRNAFQTMPREFSIQFSKLSDPSEIEKITEEFIVAKLKEMSQIKEDILDKNAE